MHRLSIFADSYEFFIFSSLIINIYKSVYKGEYGIEKVFVWHALSGYWGGISDETSDDFAKEFANLFSASIDCKTKEETNSLIQNIELE